MPESVAAPLAILAAALSLELSSLPGQLPPGRGPIAQSPCDGPHGAPAGSYSPDSTFRLDVQGTAQGTYVRLFERSELKPVWAESTEVNSYVWTPDSRWLVYAVGPIYHAPGVFALDTRRRSIRRLVAPRTISSAYPHGADVFEVCSARQTAAGRSVAMYIRLPDVDGIDHSRPYPRVRRHTVAVP
jgi:hypothetical protein